MAQAVLLKKELNWVLAFASYCSMQRWSCVFSANRRPWGLETPRLELGRWWMRRLALILGDQEVGMLAAGASWAEEYRFLACR